MLQTLREKTSGWIAFIILGAVSIPFAFFGINNYFETRTESFVAKVGDEEITPSEFRSRFEEYRRQMRNAMGENYDAALFDQPMIRRQMLDRLIDEEVLSQAAERAGTQASDALLREEIAKIQAFHTDGKFDSNQYRAILTAQQMAPRTFEDRMRRELSARELPSQVSQTAFVTDADIDRYLRLRDETRDFRYVKLGPPAVEQAEPTDAEIQKFYDAHKDEFMSPEQVSLEYVELDAAQIPIPAEADEETLRTRYDEQKSRFVVAEQRLASHVLVKVDPNADAAAQKLAFDRATKIASEARAGKDFAAIAREQSDDVGSRAQGGDLGWLERGVTQPAFEEALFALEQGKVSDPVKTDEGYHVILLREVQAERAKSFDEAKPELAKEFLDTERERVFGERSGELIDLVYRDPTSLEPAAEALKLEIKRTPLFGREGGIGLASNPAVAKAAFSDPVLVEGNVSDPIEIAPNHLVVIKVDEHRVRTPRPVAEVRDAIVQRVKAEAAAARAKTLAQALEKRLLAGAALDEVAQGNGEVATAQGASRTGLEHDAQLLAEVFRMPRPAKDKPTRALLALPGDSWALVELTSVVPGDPKKTDEAGRKIVREQLQQGESASEATAFVEALRAGLEIRVAEERM